MCITNIINYTVYRYVFNSHSTLKYWPLMHLKLCGFTCIYKWFDIVNNLKKSNIPTNLKINFLNYLIVEFGQSLFQYIEKLLTPINLCIRIFMGQLLKFAIEQHILYFYNNYILKYRKFKYLDKLITTYMQIC